MELLLNLLWLILALLAALTCWLVPKPAGKTGDGYRFRLFAFAAFLLALLCPVVSASDDLNALRTDMEESSSGQPGVKKSTAFNSTVWRDVPSPAEAGRRIPVEREIESPEQVPEYPCVSADQASAKIMGCRAPPSPGFLALVAPSAAAPFLNLDLMLQTLELSSSGLRHRLPPANAAPSGLRSTKCEIHPLTASRSFPVGRRELALIRRQPPHDLKYG
jgi:hypothetical protein